MVLLDLLAELPRRYWSFLVAHINHGMRDDSGADEELVRQVATEAELPFVSHQLSLMGQSEAAARQQRYLWLGELRGRAGAAGIMTAHQADDRLETAYYNTVRGGGSSGLVALRNRGYLVRPLLSATKQELYDYAHARGLIWREDSTNADLSITRNFIRREMMPTVPAAQQRHWLSRLDELEQVHEQIGRSLDGLIVAGEANVSVSRRQIDGLSAPVRRELVVHMVRRLNPAAEITAPAVNRLALALLTGRTGQSWPINRTAQLKLTKTDAVMTLVLPINL